MKTVKVVAYLLFHFLVIEGTKNETKIIDSILKGYDKRIRPVAEYHSSININLGATFLQILQVDEKHQVITTNIWRFMQWNDCRLKWTSEDYGNISELSISPNAIWTPDIQLNNLASYDKHTGSYGIDILYNNGRVSDVSPMVVKTLCKIDITWFPFDEQKCSFIFGSWTLSSKYLTLTEIIEITADSSEFVENGEWQLLGVSVETKFKTYSCCPNEPYMNLVYTIHLKRRPFYYFFNLLIPCGLIGFLACLGFTLPPESDEKLTLGATILFSLIAYLNMIGESMPANSDTVPLLGTYFNCVMITIALSVVSTIVVNLNVNGVNTKAIEGKTKTAFLYWLPWILRMKPPTNIACHQNQMPPFRKKVNNHNTSDISPSKQMDSMVDFGTSSENKRTQWMFIAAVVDRLCLIISLIFTFVSVTVFLIYAF